MAAEYNGGTSEEVTVGGNQHMMISYDGDGIGTAAPMIGGGASGKGVEGKVDGIKSGISGFLNYMFLFDQKTKCDLLNLSQYGLLGVGPVILLLKTIKNYFPGANDSKGSPELLIECTLEILFILLSIYFIHRLICYVPTYSGMRYDSVNFTQSVLMFLVILFTIQTKLGTKINILVRRATNMVEGYSGMGVGNVDGDEEDSYSVDSGPEMNNSLERNVIVSQSQPLSMSMGGGGGGGGGGAVPSLVPMTKNPGMGDRRRGGGDSHSMGELSPSSSESFASGTLSGAAW